MSEGFVGRVDELAAIDTLLATSRRERRVAALILVGEPGIGKSRLLDEAERRSGQDRILRFAGYEPEASVPLASASALLRYLAAASEDRTFHGLLDPDTEVGGLDAIRIFESVHRQLSRLRPVALFVDDLQWVDPVSIALCHFLVRAADGSGRGFALVVASRPSPVTDRFATSLANAVEDGALPETIQMPPLGRDEGIRFVADRSSTLARGGAIDLWERAGGSPFWLDLLVRTQGDERDFETVVAARTRGLSPDAAALLQILAVLGRPINTLDLDELLGLPSARTIDTSLELVRSGLAIDDGGNMRLAHDLVRGVVVGRIPEATRRRLHDRIANALERQSAGDVTIMLTALEHRVAAGSFDSDLASRILWSPRRRLIGAEGVRRVAGSARDVEETDIRTAIDEAAATLAAELGDQDFALDRWSAVSNATSDRALAARANLGAALAAYHVGRGDEARRRLDGYRNRADRSTDLDIAADAIEGRVLLWLEHRTDAGRAVAMRGVERGRRAVVAPGVRGQEATRVRIAYVDALVAAWEAALQAMDLDAMTAIADESLEAARGLGLRETLAARAMVGMALEHVAHQEKAAAAYREVWDGAWHAVLPMEAVDAGYRLAAVMFDRLELEEASRIASEAERLADRTGNLGRVRRSRLVKYRLAMAMSDWQEGITAILTAADDEPDPHHRLLHHQIVAVWLARVGVDEVDALGHLALARSLAATAGCPSCSRDLEVEAAEVFARFQRPVEARDALARWDSVGRPSHVEAEWLRRRAEVLLTIGDGPGDADSRAALMTLPHEADAMGFGYDALWAELDIGRVLARSDWTTATAAFRRAAARAEAGGARTLQRLADQGLRSLGARPWRRGRSASSSTELGALSAREREVAELVAAGATNPEMATRLFLSRKTIEHHVSNALTKLGLHSRTELAALVGKASGTLADRDGASPP